MTAQRGVQHYVRNRQKQYDDVESMMEHARKRSERGDMLEVLCGLIAHGNYKGHHVYWASTDRRTGVQLQLVKPGGGMVTLKLMLEVGNE